MESGWLTRRTSTQALHVIPSILRSHVSESPLVSGSSSACGSSTEPPAEGLLSKFVNTLESADIIASNKVSEINWAELDAKAGGIRRRPAYRRAEEEAEREATYCFQRPMAEDHGGQWDGNYLLNLETAIVTQ